MRAVALHADVLVAASAVLAANCVVVRGTGTASESSAGETFVIDSPILPEELQALPALVEQARFPEPAGLLATHGDWDHLLARLAFPDLALGCAPTTVARLRASPGAAQRELRAFDESLLIERERPLALGSLQALPVPGRCALGERELELHPAAGHTGEGMAVFAAWAGVLVVGDYLSTAALPELRPGGSPAEYLATLERLRGLLARCEYVVSGHGPVLDTARAGAILEQDVTYLQALHEQGDRAELPARRRGGAQRRVHEQNVVRARDALAKAHEDT